MFLGRLAKKTLNKNVNPHMLRKSSATYYADKLNRQQLCIRYGWKFSSEMPDVYISRAGVDEEKLKEVFVKTDMEDIKRENAELKTKQELSEKEIENMKAKEIETAKNIVKLANKVEKILGRPEGDKVVVEQ